MPRKPHGPSLLWLLFGLAQVQCGGCEDIENPGEEEPLAAPSAAGKATDRAGGPPAPPQAGAAGPQADAQATAGPPPGTFRAAGTLPRPHSVHTATLLKDGRVLIVGGQKLPFTDRAQDVSGDVELYDPAAGRFTRAGALAKPRALHAAALLADGRVLVTGGEWGGTHVLAEAEIYDPKKGRWVLAGRMTAPRQAHTATLLADGRVLLAGGFGGGEPGQYLATAELYDPITGRFSPTGSLGRQRQLHTATLLPDGRVLIVGGFGPPEGSQNALPIAAAEIYEPAAGRFVPTGGLGVARFLHQATRLDDGKVLITGGAGAGFGALAEAELYDPAAGIFRAVGAMGTRRQSHSATLLPGGLVLVAGGAAQLATPASATGAAEWYDPGQERFSPAGSLKSARTRHTATRLGTGAVLFAGGHNAVNVLGAELLVPGSAGVGTR
ncbi:MAG TPA: kelch repeat-containing protein [Polyangia bacterium]|nr:kelch repeat-containing protein [Polyangia bacterium]